ncbi:hypothetical protein RU820_04980 [Acidithiobacillus ferrooxidans]|uniref:Uncharacterized protein n=1 Tax=Acidithiobacillus ferrooxidans (strain ATCC 23270 / DSM 14882 / CIP 104768 / NCIMB 8455) TaxID=243159 RepID=B7J7Z6_ACIF2|nr:MULTISPECIES: hypothetical protein [Acidithiobacillus]ACK77908.1 hypothetical protein AFE_1048 [Acidithiobacillus ferrooxidans ATCC 23270]MBN6744211.1 hypothetical protein [Acidithiobacillus sp. MC2.2]MBN6746922.1 hypothetical protein [Acidithiobacillus sp. PG05]
MGTFESARDSATVGGQFRAHPVLYVRMFITIFVVCQGVFFGLNGFSYVWLETWLAFAIGIAITASYISVAADMASRAERYQRDQGRNQNLKHVEQVNGFGEFDAVEIETTKAEVMTDSEFVFGRIKDVARFIVWALVRLALFMAFVLGLIIAHDVGWNLIKFHQQFATASWNNLPMAKEIYKDQGFFLMAFGFFLMVDVAGVRGFGKEQHEIFMRFVGKRLARKRQTKARAD